MTLVDCMKFLKKMQTLLNNSIKNHSGLKRVTLKRGSKFLGIFLKIDRSCCVLFFGLMVYVISTGWFKRRAQLL